jgi:hypothetical protein
MPWKHAHGINPRDSAAFYDGREVVGGGWIV